MAFKVHTVRGLGIEALSRRAVSVGTELQVDGKEQNVPSQKVTVSLSAFISKELPTTRALAPNIRSLPCFMPSMYS